MKPETLPGFTAATAAERVQAAADRPLRPASPQKPADHGLFSDDRDQLDLVDMVRRG